MASEKETWRSRFHLFIRSLSPKSTASATDRYAVLVFHDQHLDDERLRDFANHFGELEIGRAAAEAAKRRLALPQIGDISNLDEEGQLRSRDDRRRLDSLGTASGTPTCPICRCWSY